MSLLSFSKIPKSFDSLLLVPLFHLSILVFNPQDYQQAFLSPSLLLQELTTSFPQCFSSKHQKLGLFKILVHQIHFERQTLINQWQHQYLYLQTYNLQLKVLFYSFQTPILHRHQHILGKSLQICRPTHSEMEVLLHRHRYLLFLDSHLEFLFY